MILELQISVIDYRLIWGKNYINCAQRHAKLKSKRVTFLMISFNAPNKPSF